MPILAADTVIEIVLSLFKHVSDQFDSSMKSNDYQFLNCDSDVVCYTLFKFTHQSNINSMSMSITEPVLLVQSRVSHMQLE